MKLYWILFGVGLTSLLLLKTVEYTPEQSPPVPIIIEKHSNLKTYISSKWRIPRDKVAEIVDTAEVFSAYGFPTLTDTLAIIAVESGFNQYAVSYANAKGLMQILYKPTTFDVQNNIIDGTLLLREYHTQFNSTDKAIEAYNVGIGNYRKGVRNKDYLDKVKQHKQELEKYK